MRTPPRPAVFVLCLFAAACSGRVSGGQWHHPTRSSDQWTADYAACRAEATKLVERELSTGGRSYVERNQTQLQAKLSQFSATKRRDELAETCMRRQGYSRAKQEKDGDGN